MKHVVITGSTRGIGFGLAKYFIKYGNKVTINGRKKESVTKAISELKLLADNTHIQGFTGNASEFNEIKDLWENAEKGFGKIDIWINNAGIDQERLLLWDVSESGIKDIINLNITGTILACKLVFERMKKQGSGQIYNMEGFGSNGMMMKKLTVYGTTKRAVRYFSRSLALEAKGTPVKVGTIAPGMVMTDLLLKTAQGDSEEAGNNRKIFNILADDVDTATEPIVKQILSNKNKNLHINRMGKFKVMYRFMFFWARRKDFFENATLY